jgi:inorganic pyrophosphatase
VGEKELHKGDNDPIDGVEVGTTQLRSGSITKVKVLGVLAMIDDGETDWKVLCISVDDPYASRINNLNDLDRHFPSMVPTIREWFRVYKTADGKPENNFGFGEKAMDRDFALSTIDETHEFWKTLTLSGQKTV